MEKERDRNMDVREAHQSVASEPATQACALTGNQTGDISLCRTIPNQLSHTGQG